MHIHESIPADDWVVARRTLVEELTRLRDQLHADPCELPWVAGQSFAFGTANGMPFAALFGGPEESAHGWSGLFDKLEGYLRTLN